MQQSSSADTLSAVAAGRLTRWPAFPYGVWVRLSLWLSVTVVAVLFGWGAWQRRWIADDGLIVLRTTRNMLAGNGPVFNAGERVEANTSTAWSYLMYLGGLISGPARLEYVALTFALLLSVLGIVLVMLGTARLYAPTLRGRQALLLPAGALVYIALPPARDFATSGLENGLVLAYLGLLWWMMVVWSQSLRSERTSGAFDLTLAVVAGFSVLVRPELALIGGLALVMMLIATKGWRRRALIVVAGGLLLVRVERVAVAGEGADLQSATCDLVEPRLLRGRVVHQGIQIAVGVARVAAGADFYGIAAGGLDVVQGLVEGPLGEEHREDADFHAYTSV